MGTTEPIRQSDRATTPTTHHEIRPRSPRTPCLHDRPGLRGAVVLPRTRGPRVPTESNSTSGYEVRRYPRSFWTATTVTGKNMDKAGSEAFMRLFRYISGDNELKQKIEMTVPVLVSVIPGQGPFCEENFTYHFYLPAEFQSNPPKPSDPRV